MPKVPRNLHMPLLASVILLAAHLTYAQSAPAPAASAAPQAAADIKAESYSLGVSFASQWHEGGIDSAVSTEDLIRGIRAGLTGTPVTAENQKQASELLHQAYQSWATRNQTAADEFLAGNAKQPGIKTTASGLQYQILKAGTAGAAPAAPADHVTVQYRGKLLNGREFDSTYARGQPAVIRPNDVIAGWREALAMMPAGSQWRLFIPPNLAYALTPPPAIPPDSLLIFDIEVVSIDKAPTHAAMQGAPQAPAQKH